MKAFTCSSLSPPWGGSRALALALRAPRISSWPTRSLPCAASRSPSGVGRAHQPKAHTWWTRALQARPIIRLGLSNTACGGSARQNVTAHGPGPSGFAAGWRGSARWSRLSMTSSPTRSGSIANARMPLVVFRRAWPPRSPYTISVSGSMSNLAGLVWPLQTWWTGKLTFHTKRLTGTTAEAMAEWISEGIRQDRAGKLERICRANARGDEVLAAEGYEVERTCGLEAGAAAWNERVLVV